MEVKLPIKGGVIYTIGHSTHSLDEFLGILKAYEIGHLVDIRTLGRSRHNPQFNEESLGRTLPKNGIKYTHLKGLGGLRKPLKDSQNLAWKNAAFRGFADYMQTEEFGENLCNLIELALKEKVAIMCAEALYWRCHRTLVSDALWALNIPVQHILSKTSAKTHKLTPWGRIQKGRVSYPS